MTTALPDRRDGLRPRYVGDGAEAVTVIAPGIRRRVDVQSIARDQTPFAVRLRPWHDQLGPGVRFSARTVELGGGHFTNCYELAVDTGQVELAVASSAEGFYLPGLLDPPGTLAAISGSFSFISDAPAYWPAEPCLDFCCRAGVVVSLPTIAKPAVLIDRAGPRLRTLAARGTVSIGDRAFAWVGSKSPEAADPGPSTVVVYGAANCRVRYSAAERTGFLRWVDRRENTTPPAPGSTDLVVVQEGGHQVVREVRHGGGTDLFAGLFILRAHSRTVAGLRPGARVRVLTVDGIEATTLLSGVSIGPSAADAHQGDVLAYDESLGTSPFGSGTAYARTLLSLDGDTLRIWVFDGAPLTSSFRGITPAQAVRLLSAAGIPPEHAYHLDGGQSSKLAVQEGDVTTVVGSMHYLQWPENAATPFRWRGYRGRRLRSALVVRRRDHDA